MESLADRLKTPREWRQYEEYMKSEEWRELRGLVIERDGHACRICFTGGSFVNPLQVHHRTYERLFHEVLDDLVTMCKDCHTDRDEGKRELAKMQKIGRKTGRAKPVRLSQFLPSQEDMAQARRAAEIDA